ncbi:hypothetical protein DZF91_03145, partial [Actinomadura logoneensis]
MGRDLEGWRQRPARAGEPDGRAAPGRQGGEAVDGGRRVAAVVLFPQVGEQLPERRQSRPRFGEDGVEASGVGGVGRIPRVPSRGAAQAVGDPPAFRRGGGGDPSFEFVAVPGVGGVPASPARGGVRAEGPDRQARDGERRGED